MEVQVVLEGSGVIWIAFFLAIVTAVLCRYIAGQKNRDQTNWTVLGFFLGILALIAIAGLPAIEEDGLK